MKPKDLKALCSWEERHPVISDGVFYVPEYYQKYSEFSFPQWDHPSLFGNSNPVCIEFCAGNGDWIAEKARVNPQLNWVAVEIRFDRVRKIWSKKTNENLKNLLIVSGEAWTFAHHYVPDASIHGVYINFPDPWPKNKHGKHRIIKSPFVAELVRILKVGREVTFVTDDPKYASAAISIFLKNQQFKSSYPEPFFVFNAPNYGYSYFESLWREMGKNIYYSQFVKTGDGFP